jgi:spore coat protein CotH
LTAHGIPEFKDFDFSKNIFLLLDMLNVITTLESDTFEEELGEHVELDLEIQLI